MADIEANKKMTISAKIRLILEGGKSMSNDEKWRLDLEEYIKLGEPDQVEKTNAWQTAIGLQQVDGLQTSDYLLDTAKDHIEGNINIKEAQNRIFSYYEAEAQRQAIEDGTAEADIVSSRIAELLGEKTFQFSPVEYQNIHRRLFEGVLDEAGVFRTYNISKKEWVLNGKSVLYASWKSISDTLEYDFRLEREFYYDALPLMDAVKHLVKFTASIWQIHPFCEGNTRATAVFVIKYMRSFGFQINNEVFQKHSWYFRNALVRANYNDLQQGIHATTLFLERFFSNLLLNTNYELKNRTMHVDYKDADTSAFQSLSKVQSRTLDCSLDEWAVLNLVAEEPTLTQQEICVKLGKSLSFIKRITVSLQEKGYLTRVGGKRYGHWGVNKKLDGEINGRKTNN